MEELRSEEQSRQEERAGGRFLALRWLVVGCGLLLAARVVQIQVFQHEHYRARADRQWGKEVALNAERGNLYDRHGRPLALSVTTWQVGVSKKLVKDTGALCRVLAEVLEMPEAEVRRKLAATRSAHAVIARNVVLSAEQKLRLDRDGQQAVTTEDSHARIYPADGVGGSLVGFFRKDPQQDVTTGFESSLDRFLAGRPGRGREIRTGHTATKLGHVVLEEPVHGQSLVLTLDMELQSICEDRLAEAVRKYGAEGGSVLVMDPANGDILAAASWPLLDTRSHSQPNPRVWQNRNFTQLFEPGSVFKIFSTASLLRNGAIDTMTSFNCDNNSGERIYVRNDGGHDYGQLSLMRAFSKSSNVFFAKASANLRPQELYRDLTAFGFGQETALLYPGQVSGILRDPAAWSGRSQQTIAIGQEVAVTSLQLGLALCSVANGGVLHAPRFVREIRDDRGRTLESIEPLPLRRVMSEPLSGLLREAMRRVVTDGTGVAADLDWIETGGKTGTAQKSRDGRTFTPGAYVASFGALVPIDDPRLVILTLLDEPRGIHHYAAQSAVPLYKSIVCDIRRSTDWLTDVPGSRTAPFLSPDEQQLVTVPDVMFLSTSHAVQRLGAVGLTVGGAEKDGLVIQQIPAAGTRCAPDVVVTLAVAEREAGDEAEATLCPDFTGLSNRQVLSLAARLSIPVSVQGVGYVVFQDVAAGTTWDQNGVTLVLQESSL